MLDLIANHLDAITGYAPTWGYVLIFFFMAVESSFLPFPSEVVMIPAGFLAARGDLTFGTPVLDLAMSLLAGTLGCIAGAYVNYFLAVKLGRPLLYKYGKYFFLSEKTLARAEEVFRDYGELATFVCRLLPGIRQLISIPAGLARMDFKRFTFFTALGAGIWNIILALAGWFCGKAAGTMTYQEMIHRATDTIHDYYGWIFAGLALLIAAYLAIHHKVMKSNSSEK